MPEVFQVLLVEDDSTDAFILTKKLSRLYPCSEITRVSTSAEGMRLLREGRVFQLILTDLFLPDVDCQEGVRELVHQASPTPVVVLTGANCDLAEEVLLLGAQDWLSKQDAHDRVFRRVIDHARHRGRVMASMRQLSLTDSLTGALNRAGLIEELERALSFDLAPVTLLLMDLDRFKAVNDTFGHPVGDQVLCDVAARMRELVGNGCLARLGGDEFAVVLRGWSAEAVEQLCEALQAAIDEPFVYDAVVAEIGVSIGVAFGEPGEGVSAVMTRADEAMYTIKRQRTAAALPAADTVPLYDIDSQMCGIGIYPAVSGRWSVASAAHWVSLCIEKAAHTGQRIFLFVPDEALPELAIVLSDQGVSAERLCLLVSGAGVAGELAKQASAIREVGVGVGLDRMGSAQCGVSVLMHFRPDVVVIDASLIGTKHAMAKAVLAGVLMSCQIAGVPVLLPPRRD